MAGRAGGRKQELGAAVQKHSNGFGHIFQVGIKERLLKLQGCAEEIVTFVVLAYGFIYFT